MPRLALDSGALVWPMRHVACFAEPVVANVPRKGCRGSSTPPIGDATKGKTQVSYPVLLGWLIGPTLALTAFGVDLFKRDRTLASALVALGFGAAALGGIANALYSYDVSFMYGGMDRTLFAMSVELHGGAWILTRLLGPGGMWLASLSLLWAVFDRRGAASPNNRWRGP